ncbi:unnamed protein product [Hymenolepis diminuta]|uniref:Uncharacterized protein n=1 Tax=Hymenolepis diminuta TaxID=6216 RepID=A0A564YSX6_HYMDI|nr:unnamed protein product [Hymenolepis diminuta]
MTHNPRLSDMSKRVLRFPPLFYNCLASHKKHICAHALAWPSPSDSYKANLVCPDNTHWSVRTPTRPVHLLSSSACCSLSLSASLCYSLWLP